MRTWTYSTANNQTATFPVFTELWDTNKIKHIHMHGGYKTLLLSVNKTAKALTNQLNGTLVNLKTINVGQMLISVKSTSL